MYLVNVLTRYFIVEEACHLPPDRNCCSALRNKITSFLSHDAVTVVPSHVDICVYTIPVRRTLINSYCRTSVCQVKVV
jgi:hypothetical protein